VEGSAGPWGRTEIVLNRGGCCLALERPPAAPARPLGSPSSLDSIVLASGPGSEMVAARPGSLRRELPGRLCNMSDRPLSRTRQSVALCMLAAAVVTIGLAIAGALTGARSPAPQLASQK
jgi:hypothetical protein